MRATCIYGSAKTAGGEVNHLSLHARHHASQGKAGDMDIASFLLSQGWAELADNVTEATYIEAVASAQNKKVGIWGDGSP